MEAAYFSKGDRMQFEEKAGTMWSVLLERGGKPYKRVFLSAPTSEEAQARVQAVFGDDNEKTKVASAQAALYAMANPMPITGSGFMWLLKR
jgi:hypothetical protein